MSAEFEAIKAALGARWPVHLYSVDGTSVDSTGTPTVPRPPYVVLEGPSYGRPDELPVVDETEDRAFTWRLKAVGVNTASVVQVLAICRGVLSPNGAQTVVPMSGRLLVTRFERSEFVGVDTSVKVINSNTFPAVGVETYQLTSQPTT